MNGIIRGTQVNDENKGLDKKGTGMGLLSLSDSALHNGYEHFSVCRMLLSVKYINTTFEI
jgi:hypothetical protein